MSKRERERKVPKFVWLGMGALVLGVLLFVLYEFVITPQITLKGGKEITLEYMEVYKEKGYKASFLGKDITKDVKVSGKVNEKKLGNYSIKYKVKSSIFTREVTRKVSVKDQKKPKLEIDKKDIYLCPGDTYKIEEVKATDNYDGDLTKKVKGTISKEKDSVTYEVTDSNGNKKVITKKIFYEDKTPPVMTLNGENPSYGYLETEYHDYGVTVTDNCDKDIQGKVQTTGSVDTSKLGENTLHYEVTDSAGNKAEIDRNVTVKERKGIIYLTFDDGPNSGTTNVILDILKQENVKATFFVTGYGPDELIKREFDEGHTVALHTMVHDYARVYASDEAYFNDLAAIQTRVKNITGVESKIIRFPGGSSNTVSRHYSTGIMSRITQETVNRGFRYYDWNISSGDAGSTTDPNVVYSNVVNSLSPNRSNMVLMHDVKSYTRDALRSIIRYGKEHGYTFEKITLDTPMVTQRVNN